MTARSYLFVPGDRRGVLSKAHLRGADAVIADLEDGVAVANKDEARRATLQWLDSPAAAGCQRWVRLNGDDEVDRDLEELEGSAFDGVVIPKVTEVGRLARIASRVRQTTPDASIMVLVETASALRRLDDIAASEPVDALMLGEVDLGAELGIGAGSPSWMPIRTELVVVSAAARLAPPIAGVNRDFRELDSFERETRILRAMGFGARAAIHPAQVPPINEVFTPTESEIQEARRLFELQREAAAAGLGVYVDDQGKMVDAAVLRNAQRVLNRAERYS